MDNLICDFFPVAKHDFVREERAVGDIVIIPLWRHDIETEDPPTRNCILRGIADGHQAARLRSREEQECPLPVTPRRRKIRRFFCKTNKMNLKI